MLLTHRKKYPIMGLHFINKKEIANVQANQQIHTSPFYSSLNTVVQCLVFKASFLTTDPGYGVCCPGRAESMVEEVLQ